MGGHIDEIEMDGQSVNDFAENPFLFFAGQVHARKKTQGRQFVTADEIQGVKQKAWRCAGHLTHRDGEKKIRIHKMHRIAAQVEQITQVERRFDDRYGGHRDFKHRFPRV